MLRSIVHRAPHHRRSVSVAFTASVEYGGVIRRTGDLVTVPVHVADALIASDVACFASDYVSPPASDRCSSSGSDSGGDFAPPHKRRRRKKHDGDSQ